MLIQKKNQSVSKCLISTRLGPKLYAILCLAYIIEISIERGTVGYDTSGQ